MALHYVDTSALIKRYVPEAGSSWFVQFAAAETIAVSALCRIELASALSRRIREGSMSEAERDAVYAAFLDDQTEYVEVPFDLGVVAAAVTLCLTTRLTASLRALDAIHLASARELFDRNQADGVELGALVTADRELARAAAEIGLSVLDPLAFE